MKANPMKWKPALDTEDSQPCAVWSKAVEWLDDLMVDAIGGFIPARWQDETPAGGCDHIYLYRMGRASFRVHWHTCCQDHPVWITKLEVVKS